MIYSVKVKENNVIFLNFILFLNLTRDQTCAHCSESAQS